MGKIYYCINPLEHQVLLMADLNVLRRNDKLVILKYSDYKNPYNVVKKAGRGNFTEYLVRDKDLALWSEWH